MGSTPKADVGGMLLRSSRKKFYSRLTRKLTKNTEYPYRSSKKKKPYYNILFLISQKQKIIEINNIKYKYKNNDQAKENLFLIIVVGIELYSLIVLHVIIPSNQACI